MRTEDVPLDIKAILDRKGVRYTPADVARLRHLCRVFVENMIELQRRTEVDQNSI